MATQQKFYLMDTTTTNTGTMPSNSPTTIAGGVLGTGSEAAGASTARATSAAAGTSNPDIESLCTAQASSAIVQRLGHRRFVTPPIAATTFAGADGNWTWSFARLESNTNHNATSGAPFQATGYLWRPGTGARVGTVQLNWTSTFLAATTQTANSVTATWSGTQAIVDGDIVVFDIWTLFQQSMATAYTDSFCYDGTTEASTTTCASFVNAPAALTLYTPVSASLVPAPTTVPTYKLM